LKNWKKSAKEGVIKIGNILLKTTLTLGILLVIAYYAGILSGVAGGVVAHFFFVLGKLPLELEIPTVILVSLTCFLSANWYFKKSDLSYISLIYRETGENGNGNNNSITSLVK